MATEHKDAATEELTPPFYRRCGFCSTVPGRAFHGKCTDPFGSKGECFCYAVNETHRWQWDFIAGLNRGDDLEHDTAKDTDDGLPHDKDIRGWEENTQRYEDRMIG